MADIVVVGGGLGGLPTALELRHLLPQEHRVLLVSDRPQFTFIPSLPWVGLDMTALARVQMELAPVLERVGIVWISGTVTALDPQAQTLEVGEQALTYDYLVIATGARLAMELVPGLGPDTGYTQSVCNPHHAQLARTAWQKFLEAPGPLVFGAVPGASCFGPAYEFCLLADYILRRKGLREQVDITFVTPEPYLGHLGIGGMANAAELITDVMAERGIRCIANAAVTKVTPQEIWLADGLFPLPTVCCCRHSGDRSFCSKFLVLPMPRAFYLFCPPINTPTFPHFIASA
jgi:sulfide:quinone oxidoreductase